MPGSWAARSTRPHDRPVVTNLRAWEPGSEEEAARRLKQRRRQARKKLRTTKLRRAFQAQEAQRGLEQRFSATKSNRTVHARHLAMRATKQAWRPKQNGADTATPQTLDTKVPERSRRECEIPEWRIRQAGQLKQAQRDYHDHLECELANIPPHMLQIMDEYPNFPSNNFPYRPRPKSGHSRWPIQGMQGKTTPVRTAPFASSDNTWETTWKTIGKDDLFDPVRDGPCLPSKSMKEETIARVKEGGPIDWAARSRSRSISEYFDSCKSQR